MPYGLRQIHTDSDESFPEFAAAPFEMAYRGLFSTK